MGTLCTPWGFCHRGWRSASPQPPPHQDTPRLGGLCPLESGKGSKQELTRLHKAGAAAVPGPAGRAPTPHASPPTQNPSGAQPPPRRCQAFPEPLPMGRTGWGCTPQRTCPGRGSPRLGGPRVSPWGDVRRGTRGVGCGPPHIRSARGHCPGRDHALTPPPIPLLAPPPAARPAPSPPWRRCGRCWGLRWWSHWPGRPRPGQPPARRPEMSPCCWSPARGGCASCLAATPPPSPGPAWTTASPPSGRDGTGGTGRDGPGARTEPSGNGAPGTPSGEPPWVGRPDPVISMFPAPCL